MATNTKVNIQKPNLSEKALEFASGGNLKGLAGQSKGATNKTSPKGLKQVSGLIPLGDVRLTANIKQDLHLKLKIHAAEQRTTIGEVLENLISKYL